MIKPELEKKHAAMVAALIKPGEKILTDMLPSQAHLLHMAVGVAGEAGELLDCVKKYAIYQKPLDRANAVEELGDLEFFMQGIREELRITREEALADNMLKLAKRYHEGKFTKKAAINRADKS